MNTVREVLFDLFFNAFLQIALFAIVAAAFSPFIAKAKAKHQHLFYLGVLILCLAVPVINTLWHSLPDVEDFADARARLR
jgi:formate-dependent nitrite reductase membrane component NrfD